MKTIKKSIEINASREKVWQVLTEDRYTKIWYSEFHEGSQAETDWQLGSKAVFKDPDGNGIVGTIIKNTPLEIITIEYSGMIMNNVEDYDSDWAKAMKGVQETYILSEKDGITTLNIECGMMDEMYDMMDGLWDKALAKFKELAEQN
jgi:uncharacterized protein YndB with AHSA1/START domain